jgi:hypothetical protein
MDNLLKILFLSEKEVNEIMIDAWAKAPKKIHSLEESTSMLSRAIVKAQADKICSFKVNCKECGSEIIFDWVTPSTSYSFNHDSNAIERQDNELHTSHVEFHCSNDREHDWEDKTEPFIKVWKNALEIKFMKEVLQNESARYSKNRTDS